MRSVLPNLLCHFDFDLFYFTAQVEAYMEKMFYNLTTVALHNWKTYGEMRALATYKFDTNTVEDHLPPQTLEQVRDKLSLAFTRKD